MAAINGALLKKMPGRNAFFDQEHALRHMHPPLAWWRLLPAAAFRVADLRPLRRAMRETDSIDHPRWLAAVAGDPAAAIEIAIKMSFKSELTAPLDLVATAVLCCAINGNAAAEMVLAATLRRQIPINPQCRELEASWFVADSSTAESGPRRAQGSRTRST